MSDNRKYYYLKLKENYFDDDSIVLLESMQDGVLYSNILLKLYLKSLKHGGRLQLDENIPHTAQMIATITRQQIDCGEGLANLPEAGPCGSAGQRHLLHEQYRTADWTVLYRGRAKASGKAPKQGAFRAPDKWRTFVRHSSTRDRVRERDRDKERDREGTTRAHLWPLSECFPDRRGTGRFAGQLSHRMGPVHRKAVRVYGFYRQAVIRAMPPPSGAGPVRTPGKRPRPLAPGITA